MRKLILTTASVLALGLAAAGANAQATPGTGPMHPQNGMSAAPQSGTSLSPSAAETPQSRATASPATVQQAQRRLRDDGLYHGSIDGVLGPQTKQALRKFQKKNGLPETATLDQETVSKLTGSGLGEGSSMPPSGVQQPGGGTRTMRHGTGSAGGSYK
jgi:peptidoglycan hydrolase-like protein with peptidoglycan-binding domain